LNTVNWKKIIESGTKCKVLKWYIYLHGYLDEIFKGISFQTSFIIKIETNLILVRYCRTVNFCRHIKLAKFANRKTNYMFANMIVYYLGNSMNYWQYSQFICTPKRLVLQFLKLPNWEIAFGLSFRVKLIEIINKVLNKSI